MCSVHEYEFFDNEEVCVNCGFCSGVHYDEICNSVPPQVLFAQKLKGFLTHPVTGDKLSPQIQEKTIALYNNVVNTCNIRGFKNKTAMLSTCLFYVCITNTNYITWQDIKNHSQLSLKRLNAHKKKFVEFFPEYSAVYMKPSDFMSHIFARHSVPADHFEDLHEKCKMLDCDPNFINSNPAMVAGCLVYWYQSKSINTLCRIHGFNYKLVQNIVRKIQDKFS